MTMPGPTIDYMRGNREGYLSAVYDMLKCWAVGFIITLGIQVVVAWFEYRDR